MKTDLPAPIKVIIADDHVLYRAGVKTALSAKEDIDIVAEADNGQHLLSLLKAMPCDVILLDIEMPIMTGVEALPKIKEGWPDTKVIILSYMEDQSMVTKLMDMGANSYLAKNSDVEIIYEAIKTCVGDEYYFSALTNKALLANLKQKNTPEAIRAAHADVKLNENETSVLRLMCEEKSTKEIADIIDLSPRTVEAIRDKLKVKTGAKSTAGLIMYAVRNKIVEEP